MRSISVSTFSIARSVFLSAPINLACKEVPSCKITVIELELAITWLFVTISPSLSIIKPDPAAVSLLLCLGGGVPGTPRLSKKSLKKSSKGEPGGN
mgnify:CR=1 FL=1